MRGEQVERRTGFRGKHGAVGYRIWSRFDVCVEPL